MIILIDDLTKRVYPDCPRNPDSLACRRERQGKPYGPLAPNRNAGMSKNLSDPLGWPWPLSHRQSTDGPPPRLDGTTPHLPSGPAPISRCIPAVDMDRLEEIAGQDLERMRYLLDLYFSEAQDLLAQLRLAIRTPGSQEALRVTRKLAESSAACGVTGLDSLLQTLERSVQGPSHAGTEVLLDAIAREIESIQRTISSSLGHSMSDEAESVDPAATDSQSLADVTAAFAKEGSPVDFERLKEIFGDDMGGIKDLLKMYLNQADELMPALQAAVDGGVAEQITRLAHKLAGASVACGLNLVADPLHRLEERGRSGSIVEAGRWFEETTRALGEAREWILKTLGPI